MAKSPEDENIIGIVEEIINESARRDIAFAVRLSEEHIQGLIDILAPLHTGFNWPQSALPEDREMVDGLMSKLLFASQPHASLNRVNITPREADFVDAYLLHQISMAKRVGRTRLPQETVVVDGMTERVRGRINFRSLNMEFVTQTMALLVGFNEAIEDAGMKPRRDFVAFRQGL